MGARHFKQMYEDALLADRKALPIAMNMRAVLRAERESKLGPPWADVSADKLMVMARKLLELNEGLSDRLKSMLLTGGIRVFVSDFHGKLHKIRDPRVIDFDDPIAPAENFNELVESYLAGRGSRSGEQN